jgi:hypothetical protein
MEKLERFVSAGIVSKLKGSNECRARSIGDMEVASDSLGLSSAGLSWSGRELVGQRGKIAGG